MVPLQHRCTSSHKAPELFPMSSALQGCSVGYLGLWSSLVKLGEDRLGTSQEWIQ